MGTLELLHISQEPRKEMLVPFDGNDCAYQVQIDGETAVTLFCEGGYLFVYDAATRNPNKAVRRVGPGNSWDLNGMVLANQGGRWVATAGPEHDLQILSAMIPDSARARARELTREDLAPVDWRRQNYRAIILCIAAIAGVAVAKDLLESCVESFAASFSEHTHFSVDSH